MSTKCVCYLDLPDATRCVVPNLQYSWIQFVISIFQIFRAKSHSDIEDLILLKLKYTGNMFCSSGGFSANLMTYKKIGLFKSHIILFMNKLTDNI